MVIYDSTLAIWAAMFTLVSLLGLLVLTIRDIQLQNRCWRLVRKSPIFRFSLCLDWPRSAVLQLSRSCCFVG